MIVRNEILIPKRKNEYLEVREIAVKGSDYKIGKDLAEIGIETYDVRLDQYSDPVYGKARQGYMQRNFPALAERALGVADAFQLALHETSYDTTVLPFDLGDIACSAIYFPPTITENKHPCVCHNLDWYEASVPELEAAWVGIKGKPARKSLSRISAVEFYPEKGCNAVQLGSHDLLNPPMDGINEKGLFVTILTDLQGLKTPMPFGGAIDTGISFAQLTSMLLNKCSTVEKAKFEILQQRIYFPFRAQHFLIGDTGGNVTLFEIDGKSGLYYFTDGKPDQPFIVTNHTVHMYPDPSKFPKYDPQEEYNTFNRWNRLDGYVQKHEGAFTKEDMFEAMSLVYSHYKDSKASGGSFPFTERTMYSYVADIAEKNISIKFYSRDGPPEDGSQDPTLIFHDAVTLAMHYD